MSADTLARRAWLSARLIAGKRPLLVMEKSSSTSQANQNNREDDVGIDPRAPRGTGGRDRQACISLKHLVVFHGTCNIQGKAHRKPAQIVEAFLNDSVFGDCCSCRPQST